MADTIAADQLTLYDLEQRFGLQRSTAADAFPEWRTQLPALSMAEQTRLDPL